ncbi:MAG TPA: lactate 2-monooxygenase [Saprospiraceae bacterium]|nr:lactate 2-monooxygenase [Saprospiraceae bacterium]HMP14880.1 lactate 2-monooxygenase [Saprospiraceae bacterium]
MTSDKKNAFSAIDLQRRIYIGGMGGAKPIVPLDFQVLESAARQRMSAQGFAYMAGGAGLETTMHANRKAFERWQIVPRMLHDVSERQTTMELFGQQLPAPMLTCPIGVLEMAHPEADLAVARATASLGVPMIFSNQASVPMEACAAAMGDSPRWFQLYWSKSDALVQSLVQRAERCGCQAIVVTLDTTMLGWRTRDLDLAYLPFLRGMGIAQYTSDPVFTQMLDNQTDNPSAPMPAINLTTIRNLITTVNKFPGKGFFSKLRSGKPLNAVRQFISIYSRPSLTWKDLPLLRQYTKLPVLLKGILHPDDARQAIDAGMDGIIVSNHGGRQVDGAIGAFDALPVIAEAVDNQIPILLDSGVRSGADVFKAIALGAKAVCIGRPYAYGLAIAGQAGVEAILQHFIADFELTMGLAGCTRVSDITKDMLISAP